MRGYVSTKGPDHSDYEVLVLLSERAARMSFSTLMALHAHLAAAFLLHKEQAYSRRSTSRLQASTRDLEAPATLRPKPEDTKMNFDCGRATTL